jgi:hypothetical protein
MNQPAALATGNPVERKWWFIAAALLVAAFRLLQCARVPVETGDVVRNLLYGVVVDEYGLASAGRTLVSISAQWSDIAWSQLPYNYPPIALAFFSLIAAISPTVFAVKFGLTIIEGINAWFLARLSDSPLLGLLYWLSPLSIWWVSREGQFEPLQTLFTLCALLALARYPFVCGLAIACAISVKVTAAALLPWIAFKLWQTGRRGCVAAALGFALGCVPAIVVECAYGGISNIFRYSAPLVYNPYYWNWTADMFAWNRPWQIAFNETASYGLLVLLIALAVRSRHVIAFLAPIAFVLFCKIHTNVQFWYFLLLPAFLVPLPKRSWRFALIALCPLLDVRSAVELSFGAFGQQGYRGAPSAFAEYRAP